MAHQQQRIAVEMRDLRSELTVLNTAARKLRRERASLTRRNRDDSVAAYQSARRAHELRVAELEREIAELKRLLNRASQSSGS